MQFYEWVWGLAHGVVAAPFRLEISTVGCAGRFQVAMRQCFGLQFSIGSLWGATLNMVLGK